ncbi:hypothetical protein [Crassaminicella indica]|uniref:Uncharacterized protein n=1 Tax=Crassaminicella indica TaxID=2855394 RepID=A0ABX8RAJ1_9CLOT|nr:hypothetical protein [Crassaminicella indica]QXM06075.1 hypothetical protein KVH43_12090 [Crassaminicella indica]
MTKYLNLFLKIILILIIFSILLPQFIDHLIHMYIMQERNEPHRGNSTFVSKVYIEENHFEEYFSQMLKCFIK